jgi:uncharacterized protein YndB with AHSA1/START domain
VCAVVKRITVRRTIDAPAARVWQLLTDVHACPRWGPSIRAARLDDPGIGLTRHATGAVTVLGGVTLRFVITEFTDGRSWAWDVGGVPATSHHVDDDGGRCVASIDVPIPAALYLAICHLGLRRIDQLATAT